MMMRTRFAVALLAATLVASPGCGGSGKTVWVTGKLLKGGAAYVPPEGQNVNVTFIGLETQDASGKMVQGGEPYQADVDQAKGTFSVPGTDGRGIPPGKYRVAVVQKLRREALEKSKVPGKPRVDRETDLLKNQFSAEQSPIVRELTSSCELAIDLDRPGEAPASR
jgi:hypothetical protein